MKLLKLVIVDDEPILLQGLVKTYNWNEMGFEVAGQAQSGEQAIEVIKKVKPHVVLTDIRMKQVSGLMVMEEIQKTELDPVFIGAPGGARFLRVKVPNPPGSGKDIAEGKGAHREVRSEGSRMWGTY